ncbi:MAG: exonuclease domain-containing protein [Chlamydia sp.]
MTFLRPIFFDLETTGVRPDRDRIIEIAAIDPYQNRTFQTLINPLMPIPLESQEIHGINDDMVKLAPIFASAAKEFIQFCKGAIVLIAHNGETFDIPFLSAEFTRHNLTLPENWAFIDSLKWARKYRKDLPRHSLQYLRQIFGISENRAHRALDDVQVLYKVFSLLVDDLEYDEILERVGGHSSLASFQKKRELPINGPATSVENLPYSLF